MKITVIGAGNMGGAMIRGWLSAGKVVASELTVVNGSAAATASMERLGVRVVADAKQAVSGAGLVLIAVKPWVVDDVARGIAPFITRETLVVSVASGVDFDQLTSYLGKETPLFRAIPNTAAMVGQSMTFVASRNTTAEQRRVVVGLFESLGSVMEITPEQVGACTALASCGIAYAMRYVRAAMEGGVEMGIPAAMGQQIIVQTLRGAAEILSQEGAHPEVEIDRVTTPGGITIQGLNKMEECGFTHAVIEGLKASNRK